MTTILFDTDSSTHRISLVISGHADYDERGKDIVCASTSILTYTIAKIVSDMHEWERITKNSVIRLKEGEAFINCHCVGEEAYNELLGAFRVVLTGYRLLAENYPQNIDVKAL
jgi:uncharacterized protein YsxB (DUF464 family)